jgi:hypothetical protein
LYDGKGFLPLPFIFAFYFANENYTLRVFFAEVIAGKVNYAGCYRIKDN